MLKRIVLFSALLILHPTAHSITLGNFTAQPYIISVEDNNLNLLLDNFTINAQQYIDLGPVETPQLPIIVKVWHAEQTKLIEQTMMSEFAIEHVPSLKIFVHNTDMWLMYADENNELQITNLAKQQSTVKEVTEAKQPSTTSPTKAPTPKTPEEQQKIISPQHIRLQQEGAPLEKLEPSIPPKPEPEKPPIKTIQAPMTKEAPKQEPAERKPLKPSTATQPKTEQDLVAALKTAQESTQQSSTDKQESLAPKIAKIEPQKKDEQSEKKPEPASQAVGSEENEMMPLSEPMVDKPMEELTQATTAPTEASTTVAAKQPTPNLQVEPALPEK